MLFNNNNIIIVVILLLLLLSLLSFLYIVQNLPAEGDPKRPAEAGDHPVLDSTPSPPIKSCPTKSP